MITAMRKTLVLLLVTAAITVYVIREFHPEQPLHHELNGAAGVLIIAAILLWCFGPNDNEV